MSYDEDGYDYRQNTRSEARALLEPEKFKNWLASLPEDHSPMLRCDGEVCPLARYLEANGYNAFVEKTGITIRMGDFDETRFDPPSWALAFINQVDAKGCGTIQPDEALALLEPSNADAGDEHQERH